MSLWNQGQDESQRAIRRLERENYELRAILNLNGAAKRGPFDVVRQFEAEICRYTGAPFAVTTNSCTMALTLAVAWHLRAKDVPHGHAAILGTRRIEIPRRTYVSVPMAIVHAGGRPTFRDEKWEGCYRLDPLPVWDSARWFTSGIYHSLTLKGGGWAAPHPLVCVSFHASKTLGYSQGGAILLDDPKADAWLRRARFDGRTEGVAPKDDHFDMIGWHCYLSPDVAAGLLLRLHSLPRHNAPLPNDDYPELSTMEIFR